MSLSDVSATASEFENFACDILKRLARQFPVCTSSDEFHFFPHVPPDPSHWSGWDDFSPESVATLNDQCRVWLKKLDVFEQTLASSTQRIDLGLMRRLVQTLHEQFTLLAHHENQPTFFLTIMGIGLADAIEAGDSAFRQRLAGLPVFLEQARNNLKRVPLLFNRLGCAMAKQLRDWLSALPAGTPTTAPAIEALDRLADHLRRTPAADSCLPPVDVYARIAAEHIGCRVSLSELAFELDLEIDTTTELLQRHAADIAPGSSWQTVVDGLPIPDSSRSPVEHYRRVIETLARHCVDHGLIPADLPQRCPVTLAPIPAYMTPVRSTAAFSAVPGHPARGGTFYILNTLSGQPVPADYRLLTAHETYPGHHVLDAGRWNLDQPLRRHIEFPLFYEGWASFSEELMFETGFFAGPADSLLMAKRRFWRALRGRVDFNIHTRRQSMEEAGRLLTGHGMSPRRAQAMVQRYALKPGYQLAYALGRRRFRQIYNQMAGSQKAETLTRTVLSQGEIEFDSLATLLTQGG